MPAGRTFDLLPAPLRIQGLLDARERIAVIRSVAR
jgi:hypothetical protein